MILPRGWSESKVLIESYDSLDPHEYLDDYMEAAMTEIEVEKRYAFTVGVLYGMALEAGKDEPLLERLDSRGEL